MRVTMPSYIRSLSGSYKSCPLVFVTSNGAVYAREKVVPANPRTADQMRVRAYLVRATSAWGQLTAAQRDSWEGFACRIAARMRRHGGRTHGIHEYVRANVMRQTLGLGLVCDAPVPAISCMALHVVPVAAAPDCLAFRVFHAAGSVDGLRVVARMTDGMSPGRRPGRSRLRYACGMTEASSRPLPESGGVVEFGPCRFRVEAGLRYGVEVRVVRESDGLAGAPLFVDAIKQTAAAAGVPVAVGDAACEVLADGSAPGDCGAGVAVGVSSAGQVRP